MSVRDLSCCSRIGDQDPILVILIEWLELILSGKKSIEIRGEGCPSKVGKQIWLCASGSGTVTGKAYVVDQRMLSKGEWEDLRSQHLVSGDRPYGDCTHAWILAGVQRIPAIPIRRKQGSVIWQKGPGYAM